MSFGDDTLAPPDSAEVEREGFRKMAMNMASLVADLLRGVSRISDFGRASGKAVCEKCGLEYREHPDVRMGLTILCDGKQVKL